MTIEQAREIVEKVDVAVKTKGPGWVDTHWLKRGTAEYTSQAAKLGRARSIVAASEHQNGTSSSSSAPETTSSGSS